MARALEEAAEGSLVFRDDGDEVLRMGQVGLFNSGYGYIAVIMVPVSEAFEVLSKGLRALLDFGLLEYKFIF